MKQPLPYTILIVDDNEADRELYKTLLDEGEKRYRYYEAETANDAVNIYPTANPDCVLLDYVLPDATGLSVLEELAKYTSVLPVVMLTGQGSEILAVDSIKKGAQDYLPKRILTGEILKRTVSGAIDRAILLKTIANQNEALKKEKEKAEKARCRAEGANHAKGEFLAVMSHEIRTPLNSIIGSVQLLGQERLEKNQKDLVGAINTSSNMLLTLVNDILDFSKIEAGEMEIETAPVILEAMVMEVMELFSAEAYKRRLELVSRIAADVPYAIMADPVRLRQVLINLVGNAVKFTERGHVFIDVSVKGYSGHRVEVRFVVQDTGIGIPKNKKKSIFEKFSQADSSTTRKYGGTGLGLAICKQLVNLMQGKIGVESEEGKGSDFWVEIPFAFHKNSVLNAIPVPEELQKINVLLVDAYGFSRQIAAEYLQRCHIPYKAVASTEEAIRACGEGQYAIALINHNPSVLDGEALAVTVHERFKGQGPRCIVLAALSSHEQTKQESVFCRYLGKPIYLPLLLRAMAGVLQLKGYLQEASCPPETQGSGSFEEHTHFNARVLVVEDYKPNQVIIKKLLESLGCHVVTASNGDIALDLLACSHDFDMVFMDCHMPHTDGYEATQVIRSKPWGKNLTVIALTANAFKKDKEKCLQAGMDDYIPKPVRMQEIVDILKKFIPKEKQREHVPARTLTVEEKEPYAPTEALETQFERLNTDLETINYVLSHDLQKPLKQAIECLQKTNGKDRTVLESYLLRLQVLQEAVLEYARIGTAGAPPKEIDLNEIIKSVLTQLGRKITASHAVVHCDRLPTVKTRRIPVTKMFTYIIDNAITHNRSHPPVVHIEAEKEGGFWHFMVKDNGVGIPEEFQETVFVLFQKNPDNPSAQGIGAGLSLARKTVESLGGKMWVMSEVNKGSVFHFTLPVLEGE